MVKKPPARQEAWREPWVRSLGQEDPPEKEMAAHSRVEPAAGKGPSPPDTSGAHCRFAWRIPWMEEPGGRLSMGSKRVGYTPEAT